MGDERMKITIEATPEETKELLQVVGSNLEQQVGKIVNEPINLWTGKAKRKSYSSNSDKKESNKKS